MDLFNRNAVPVLPSEVIGQILSYLSKYDLLNCRLVSHSWKDECSKVARKSIHRLSLCDKKILDYLTFVNYTSSQFMLPLHAIFTSNKNWDTSPQNYISALESLMKLFGPASIPDVSIIEKEKDTKISEENWNTFLMYLGVLGSSLRKLNLNISETMTSGTIRDNFQANPLSFPNLKILEIQSRCGVEDLPESHRIVPYTFLTKSPNLEELHLPNRVGIYEAIPLKSLKLLKIGSVTNSEELFQLARSSNPLPKIENFSFRLGLCEDQERIDDILQLFSKTLKSMTITSPVQARNPRLLPFPRMRCLKSLCLRLSSGSDYLCLDPSEFNFNPETFPALETVDIQLGCFFSVRAPNPRNKFWIPSPESVFPNLQNLILRIRNILVFDPARLLTRSPFNLMNPMYPTLLQNLENLRQLYPNISNICLVDEVTIQEGRRRVIQYCLKEIMKSDLVSGIRRIEMREFDDDFLGEFLNSLDLEHRPRIVIENVEYNPSYEVSIKEIFGRIGGTTDVVVRRKDEGDKQSIVVVERDPQVHHKMLNVKKVKIECKKQRNGRSGHVNLIAMAKRFPKLQEIEVICSLPEANLPQKENLSTSFPKLNIILSHS